MNPYALRRKHLKLVRLPISPPPHQGCDFLSIAKSGLLYTRGGSPGKFPVESDKEFCPAIGRFLTSHFELSRNGVPKPESSFFLSFFQSCVSFSYEAP